MPNIKTAISLEQELFTQVDELAASMSLSRSRVFALAAEDFIKRQRKQQITEKLNEVYAEGADKEDRKTLQHMRSSHRRLVEGEW